MNPIIKIELKFLAAVIALAILSAITAPKARAAALRVDSHGKIEWASPRTHGVGVDPQLLTRANNCLHQAGAAATGFVVLKYGRQGLEAVASRLFTSLNPSLADQADPSWQSEKWLSKAFPPATARHELSNFASYAKPSGDPTSDWLLVSNVIDTDCLLRRSYPSTRAGWIEQQNQMRRWIREWVRAKRGA